MDSFDPQMQVTDVQVEPKVIIHDDHEISMSQAQCYKAAKNAMEIHKLLKMVDNLESWMQAKITLAAEYLECVASNLEYDVVSATLNEGTHEPVKENVDFPYTTAQLVKLGQKIFVRLPSITHDATANKLSALADKLVHLGGTFAEPLNDDDKKLVLSLVKPKKSDDINWSDPSKWPHKMAEAYKPTSPVDSESARRGALTRALKQLETGLKKSHPRTQLPSLEDMNTAIEVLAKLGVDPHKINS